MNFDSVTVAPYMGNDSVTPFLQYDEKWVILLALTSNIGGLDFQTEKLENGDYLFERVLKKSLEWGNEDNLMYVVGATKVSYLKEIRNIVPNSFLLIPGVGAQGGSLEDVAEFGMNDTCGLLVNSSRGIIFASSGEDFADQAKVESEKIQQKMEALLRSKNLI